MINSLISCTFIRAFSPLREEEKRMKTVKTPWNQRDGYKITTLDENLKSKRQKLLPGDDGMTEEWIRMLHHMDDSEVYYNLKAVFPSYCMTRSERHELALQKAAWREGFIAGFVTAYGYEPHTLDVLDAEYEVFPKNPVLSLDELMDEIEDEKAPVPEKIYGNETDDSCLDCLHELIRELPESWQIAYQNVVLNGMTHAEAAERIGVTRQQVDYIINRIKKIIRNNKNISSFFRGFC